MEKLTYFNNLGLIDSANFEEGDTQDQKKCSGLVLVEGVHVDSNKRRHEFSASRIKKIVDNTNAYFMGGGRIPWQKDHKKTQDFNIGDQEGPLELKVIEAEDLPNPRLKHLVGRLGVFTRDLVAKGKDVVSQIAQGSIKTLSPGIDVTVDIIKEISATPTPAIVGLSLFKKATMDYEANFNTSALTMDDAEMENMDMSQYRQDFDEMSDRFWTVMNNIQSATEEELQGADPYEYSMQAIQDYSDRLIELFGLAENPEDEMMEQGQMPMGQGQGASPMPGYVPKQQGFSSRQAQYMSDNNIAGFTMQDVERAEFGYGKLIGNTAKQIGGHVKAGNYGKAFGAAGRGAKIAGTRMIGAARRSGARVGRSISGVNRPLMQKGPSMMRSRQGASGFSRMTDAQRQAKRQMFNKQ